MLQAISKNKAYFPEQEDIITSMIFGTMSYLPDSDSFSILKYLIYKVANNKLDKISKLINVQEDTEISIHYDFWKRTQLNKEPDIIIRINLGYEYIDIWIEIKWNSGLGKDQLSNYLEEIEEYNKDKTLFIYLVKNLADAISTLPEELSDQIILMSWHELITHLDKFSIVNKDEGPNVKRWVSDILGSFKRYGIVPFHGFNIINVPVNDIQNCGKYSFLPLFSGFVNTKRIPTIPHGYQSWEFKK